MKQIASVTLSVVLLGAFQSFAADAPKTAPFKQALAGVPAAELPAKAAELVKAAKANERQAATVGIVRAALEINPAAAPSIVGAIARAVPTMAPVAAGTAAAQQPRQAGAIAKSAAGAAPKMAGKIVVAVCQAVPKDYRNVAIAVAQAVPGAGKEILNAVASALPDLKPSIERVLAGYEGNVPSVAAALDSAKSDQNGPAPLARGPAVGPPYLPPSTTPSNVTPGSSGNVPPGGRDYAAP